MAAWAVTTAGSELEFDTQLGYHHSCAQIDSNHFINFWSGGASDYFYIQVFTVNTSTWAVTTANSALNFNTKQGIFNSCAQIDSNHFINFWCGQDDDGYVGIFTVNTSTWAVTTASAALEFDPSGARYNSCAKIDSNHFINFCNGGGGNAGNVQVFTVNTSTWAVTTANSALQFDATNAYNSCTQIDSNHFINFYGGLGAEGFAVVVTVNTSTWAVTTASSVFKFALNNNRGNSCFKIDANHFINFFQGEDDDGFVQVFTVNTSTWAVTTASAALELDTQYNNFNSCKQIDSNHFINFWSGLNDDGFVQVFTVNTSTWAVTTAAASLEFDEVNGQYNSCAQIDSNHYINFWSGSGSDGYAQVIAVAPGVTTVAKTIQAKARIKQANLAKTIQAKARMKRSGVAKTIQTKARVKKINLSKTIQAKSRIKRANFAKTIQAKSRINKVNAKTIQSKGRLKNTYEPTLAANTVANGGFDSNVSGWVPSRCALTWNPLGYCEAVQNHTGPANFALVQGLAQPAGKRCRIRFRAKSNNTTDVPKIITAHYSNIVNIYNPALSSSWQDYIFEATPLTTTFVIYPVSNSVPVGTQVDLDNISCKEMAFGAKARIKRENLTKTISAKAKIASANYFTIQALGRIKQLDIAKTIQSKARLKNTYEPTTRAKARIKQANLAKTIQVKARIKNEGISKTIQAKVAIKKFNVSKTISAKSSVKQLDVSHDISAKAQIKKINLEKTIQAKSRIKQASLAKTIQAKSRIKQASLSKTVMSKARLKRLSELKTASARADIKKLGVSKTLTAKAKIWGFPAGYVKMDRGSQRYSKIMDNNGIKVMKRSNLIKTLNDNRKI